jgi:hypothetical protein
MAVYLLECAASSEPVYFNIVNSNGESFKKKMTNIEMTEKAADYVIFLVKNQLLYAQ